ncbi:hypothetical protein O181_026185 [Austropuccinia psidii MF-1]|uniref:Uncharacterized protein n=1 Tax=Austropuccinia psidii MF-1 TaxID=1389203 RepID=A0A9Q3CNW6_9BASI|nr:hypothetical protein [Austropuccinia psidii MF-1]
MNIIQLKEDYSETSIAKAENWGSWQPPTISSANDPFLNNYGLRNTKQRSSRNENPSQEPTNSLPKKMETPLKKKPNIPGAYIEDEKVTVEKKLFLLNSRNHNRSKRKKKLAQKVKKNSILEGSRN